MTHLPYILAAYTLSLSAMAGLVLQLVLRLRHAKNRLAHMEQRRHTSDHTA